MNRNQIIGIVIGKMIAYLIKGFMFTKVSKVVSPQNILLLKTGTTYGVKLVKYTSKNYARTDFSTETIFSDAIDASFFAD